MGTIAAQRWGDMHVMVDKAWEPLQKDFIREHFIIEPEALELINQDRYDEAVQVLTNFTDICGNEAVERAWKLGDELWTTFDEQW